jgi:alpha-1,6-mannosyltransferase
MKICDIVQFYSTLSGGVKRYTDDKIRYFSTQPHIEHVVIVPSDRNAVTHSGHSRIYEVKSMRLVGSRSYRLLISRRRIQQIIECEKPDILEVGDPYHTAWMAHSIARRANIPIVAYYHSDYPRAFGRTLTRFFGKALGRLTERFLTAYLTRLYNRMDATIVATPFFEAVLKEMGIQRIIRVPLGTDTERFHPVDEHIPLLKDLGLPDASKLLLYVGRMAREKNVVNLVQMMDLFPDDGTLALLLVGDGEQAKQIRNMTRQRANVFWHPYCDSPELLSVFYSAADLFVHPSTSETFGLVSLEAQSCGAPVLAVKNGGADFTLSHERDPLLAVSPSATDLYAAVQKRLQTDETDDERMERRERIIRYFGKDTTCALLLDLYELVCANKEKTTPLNEPARTQPA